MYELKDHKAYELRKKIWRNCVSSFVIMKDDTAYEGELCHKKAVLDAIKILNEKFKDSYTVAPEKMISEEITADQFLIEPKSKWYETKRPHSHSHAIPNKIPYWYAIMEAPYGNGILLDDFREMNQVLFPQPDQLEIYRWNDEFSDYFDDGKEWWGTGCWSIYDRSQDCYTVILASSTD